MPAHASEAVGLVHVSGTCMQGGWAKRAHKCALQCWHNMSELMSCFTADGSRPDNVGTRCLGWCPVSLQTGLGLTVDCAVQIRNDILGACAVLGCFQVGVFEWLVYVTAGVLEPGSSCAPQMQSSHHVY